MSRALFRLLMVATLLVTTGVLSAQAQPSSQATGNEITEALPGEDGGSVAPQKALTPNQIMFIVRSQHPKAVDIAFYSTSRRHAWPGNNRVYIIRDSNTHNYVLNCNRGEKICYGAGVRNAYRTYWGSGIGNKHRCTKCCYTCEGKPTKTIVLNP